MRIRILAVLTAWFACTGAVAIPIDTVYYATAGGIFNWSSDTGSSQQVSAFPAYEIEISSTGAIFVGNGGAATFGIVPYMNGIFRIEANSSATQISTAAADDIEFHPDGTLYFSNSGGIFKLEADGTPTQVSTNPTSQFAFDSATTVVTTNGLAYATVFGRGTDRIDLSTGTTTPLSLDGGEDIQVSGAGEIFVSGQSGILQLVNGQFISIFDVMAVFDFELPLLDRTYFGNPASYDGFSFPAGLFKLDAGINLARLVDGDVNSIEIVRQAVAGHSVPEPGTLALFGLSLASLAATRRGKR